MPRRLLIPALFAAFALLGVTLAQGEVSQVGNLRISFQGSFSPRALPRDHVAPVTVDIEGAISTTDGSHPPPVRRIEIGLNRNGKLSTVGLPPCSSPTLQSTSSRTAIERCGRSLVGRGRFGAEVQFPSATPVPATGTLLAFYGKQSGQPALLLHLYTTTPVQATFVLPLRISRVSQGKFGTVLAAKIPTLAGGLGSVTKIDLKLGRDYTFRGRRHSFLSASCAAPNGFPGAVFSLAHGSFFFADGRKLDTTLTRNCRVR
jgi:hypothetical protein